MSSHLSIARYQNKMALCMRDIAIWNGIRWTLSHLMFRNDSSGRFSKHYQRRFSLLFVMLDNLDFFIIITLRLNWRSAASFNRFPYSWWWFNVSCHSCYRCAFCVSLIYYLATKCSFLFVWSTTSTTQEKPYLISQNMKNKNENIKYLLRIKRLITSGKSNPLRFFILVGPL